MSLEEGRGPEPEAVPGAAGLAGNAAARALPLLAVLARGRAGRVAVPYLDGHLCVRVSA